MSKKLTRCFSLVLVIALITICCSTTVFASEYNVCGMWGYSYKSTLVYDETFSRQTGSLFAGEGFTILLSKNDGYYIDYSSSSGAKQGWVKKSDILATHSSNTCAGTMLSAQTVYYGTTSDYIPIGSVSTGETVCVLAYKTSKLYIEYNTVNGRKRGWVPSSSVKLNDRSSGPTNISMFGDLPCGLIYTPSHPSFYYHTVYAGPGENYCVTGSVGTSTTAERVLDMTEMQYGSQRWAFIMYSTSNGNKTGYIRIS